MKKYGVENSNYIEYTQEQLKFLNDKDYNYNFIKNNNIQSAMEFYTKAGFKQLAGTTILEKHGLLNQLKRDTSQE